MNTFIATEYGPWHHHGGPGWWLLFPICFGLLWLLVIGGGGYLLWRRTNAIRPASPSSTAEAVLAERYARGEIDEDEYRERLAVLRS